MQSGPSIRWKAAVNPASVPDRSSTGRVSTKVRYPVAAARCVLSYEPSIRSSRGYQGRGVVRACVTEFSAPNPAPSRLRRVGPAASPVALRLCRTNERVHESPPVYGAALRLHRPAALPLLTGASFYDCWSGARCQDGEPQRLGGATRPTGKSASLLARRACSAARMLSLLGNAMAWDRVLERLGRYSPETSRRRPGRRLSCSVGRRSVF
jgi:hypothetical protein